MNGVSVIIPAHNSAACLDEAVESALCQQLAPLEIIVVNDGSTDATGDVARRFGKPVVCLEQENRGQGAARNAGLAMARGEFIAFLDADDYWKPAFLKQCVEFLTRHEQAIAVSTGLITRMLDGSERIHPEGLADLERPGDPFVIEEFFEFWARHDHVRTGSNVIRHRVIKTAGAQRADLRISQDLEYWAYLGTFGSWGFIPEPLWIGNSRQAARHQGWLAKYRQRRRLCPDVEDWERRIVPRLKPSQHQAFQAIRGRVALGYAQNKILGGARASARRIVRDYGFSMPSCTLARLLRLGISGGWFGWHLACGVVLCREWSKAMRLRLGR